MNIKNQILELLTDSIKSLNLDNENLSVAFSNRPELCDYQSNFAMVLAKKIGEKPFDLAEKIVKNLLTPSVRCIKLNTVKAN